MYTLVEAGLCPSGGMQLSERNSLANADAISHLSVGVDAHIDPAERTVFAGILGEFAVSQRADVGIGPYKRMGKCIRFSLGFLKKQGFHRADRVVRPYNPTGKCI